MPGRSTGLSATQENLPDQPRRGADRNASALTNEAGQLPEDVLLPSLDAGMTLLDIEGGRGVPIVHSLVLDHLLMHEGPAFWVDTQGYATTTTLARLAPSQRLLARIHVARGFTVYQHYGALCNLQAAVGRRPVMSPDAGGDQRDRNAGDSGHSAGGPSLIVAPALDEQYRGDDTLGGDHAETLQARALARLVGYAQDYDCPILLTRTEADSFTAAIERAADTHLRCEQTEMGPRFVGDEFETVVYPVADGAYYQTTFAYWRQVLSARADLAGRQPAPTRPPANGSLAQAGDRCGTDASLTPDPLLDAWTGTARSGPGGP